MRRLKPVQPVWLRAVHPSEQGGGQPQLVVQSKLVGLGPVSSLFLVHTTGPLNTRAV